MSDTCPQICLPISERQQRLPSPIHHAGQKAAYHFLEFFTARIQNQKTRKAYFRNVVSFFNWADEKGLSLKSIQSVHVALYIEELAKIKSHPTAKQHLAALRMLFDWLLVNQVVPTNPAAPVRGVGSKNLSVVSRRRNECCVPMS